MSANKDLMELQRKERLGKIGYNNLGTKMKIIEYIRKDNLIVEFQDESKYKTKATYQNFKKGKTYRYK